MTFFYDLNKRLAALAGKQDAKQIAESVESPKSKLAESIDVAEAGYSAKAGRAGKDLGKPGKNFSKIAKGAAERYGSKAAGERVAGAVLNKLRHPKEDTEMEGNAFTGALAKTPKGGKFKVGSKEFTDTSDLEEGYAEMDAWMKQRETEKGTGKFDKRERTLPGGMKATTYTRKHADDVEDDSDAPVAKGGAPKKKGRPKGKDKGPERVTAKSYKYKAGRPAKKEKTAEDLDTDGVMMTRPTNCSSESAADPSAIKSAIALLKKNGFNVSKKEATDEVAPPGDKAERMVKHIKKSLSKDGKLSAKDKAIAYATTWKAHNQGKVEEESTAEKDDKAERAAKKVAKDIEYDEGHKGKDDKRAERAGKKVTKDIEYDDKKDKEEKKVDETTVSGSVATASPAGKSSSSGMQFGKGVYEGFNNSVEKMITESVNIAETISENEGEGKTITVTASGPEADMLMQLLKAAGLSGQRAGSGCGCGQTPCDCEQVDENSPDWPTNTEVGGNDDPTLRMYSGGLNGPKSTKQGTLTGGGLPTINPRRQVSMEESVKLERTLFDTWKNYKG